MKAIFTIEDAPQYAEGGVHVTCEVEASEGETLDSPVTTAVLMAAGMREIVRFGLMDALIPVLLAGTDGFPAIPYTPEELRIDLMDRVYAKIEEAGPGT